MDQIVEIWWTKSNYGYCLHRKSVWDFYKNTWGYSVEKSDSEWQSSSVTLGKLSSRLNASDCLSPWSPNLANREHLVWKCGPHFCGFETRQDNGFHTWILVTGWLVVILRAGHQAIPSANRLSYQTGVFVFVWQPVVIKNNFFTLAMYITFRKRSGVTRDCQIGELTGGGRIWTRDLQVHWTAAHVGHFWTTASSLYYSRAFVW